MIALLVIVLVLMVVLALVALLASSAASANQAQAVIEVARVAQIEAARGAVSDVQNTLLVGLVALLFLALVITIVYFGWRQRRLVNTPRQQEAGGHAAPGKWVSGPNANWGRALPSGQPAAQPDINQMVMLLLVKILADQQQAPRQLEASRDSSASTQSGAPWGWP